MTRKWRFESVNQLFSSCVFPVAFKYAELDLERGTRMGFGRRSPLNAAGLATTVLAVLIVATLSFAIAPIAVATAAPPYSPGTWSDPVKVGAGWFYETDSWADTIYKPNYPNITIGTDWGTNWETKTTMWNDRIEVVDYVIYSVGGYGGFMDRDHVGFNKSSDNGTTWSPTVDLGMTGWNDGYCGIFYLNSTLFVYSWNGPIDIVKSTDMGDTWSSPVNITDVQWTDPLPSDLVYLDGVLYLAYYNETISPPGAEVYVISSRDNGETWGERTLIGYGLDPVLKVDHGEMYIAYLGVTASASEAGQYFAKSLDGSIWTTPVRLGPLSDFTDTSNYHSIAVTDGLVACSYLDYNASSMTYQVRLNFSDDDGSTWHDLGNVTIGDHNSEMPSLFFGGGKLHFWWNDMGYNTSWGATYPAMYRQLTLTTVQPIPEFGAVVIPVLGSLTIAILAIRLGRERD